VTKQEVIDKIFEIRVSNNIPWRRIMEIAMEHAPDETAAVLAQVLQNDREISGWMDSLGKLILAQKP
jgi:hypothetical protein